MTQFYLSLEVFLECIFLVYVFVNGLILQMLAFCNLLCYFTLGYKRRVSIKKCSIYPRSAIMCCIWFLIENSVGMKKNPRGRKAKPHCWSFPLVSDGDKNSLIPIVSHQIKGSLHTEHKTIFYMMNSVTTLCLKSKEICHMIPRLWQRLW